MAKSNAMKGNSRNGKGKDGHGIVPHLQGSFASRLAGGGSSGSISKN